MKTYVLQIDSPEYHKGSEAIQDGRYDNKTWYTIYFKEDGEIVAGKPLCVGQVENRPEVWKLKEEEKDAVNEYLPFIPEKQETYYYVEQGGSIATFIYIGTIYDLNAVKQGVFRTEKAAQMEALRRESRAKAWMPKERGIYYFCGIITGDIESEIYDPTYSYNIMEFLQGNTHETEAKAQEWKEKYYEAFKVLFE